MDSRKQEGDYSVKLTIIYNHVEGAVPIGTDISDISNYTEEKEVLLQPFSFFKIKSVKLSLINNECDIILESLCRTLILEEKIQNGLDIEFGKDILFFD